jgi:hypothetical protein
MPDGVAICAGAAGTDSGHVASEAAHDVRVNRRSKPIDTVAEPTATILAQYIPKECAA